VSVPRPRGLRDVRRSRVTQLRGGRSGPSWVFRETFWNARPATCSRPAGQSVPSGFPFGVWEPPLVTPGSVPFGFANGLCEPSWNGSRPVLKDSRAAAAKAFDRASVPERLRNCRRETEWNGSLPDSCNLPASGPRPGPGPAGPASPSPRVPSGPRRPRPGRVGQGSSRCPPAQPPSGSPDHPTDPRLSALPPGSHRHMNTH